MKLEWRRLTDWVSDIAICTVNGKNVGHVREQSETHRAWIKKGSNFDRAGEFSTHEEAQLTVENCKEIYE